jgi:hypothetical protein
MKHYENRNIHGTVMLQRKKLLLLILVMIYIYMSDTSLGIDDIPRISSFYSIPE